MPGSDEIFKQTINEIETVDTIVGKYNQYAGQPMTLFVRKSGSYNKEKENEQRLRIKEEDALILGSGSLGAVYTLSLEAKYSFLNTPYEITWITPVNFSSNPIFLKYKVHFNAQALPDALYAKVVMDYQKAIKILYSKGQDGFFEKKQQDDVIHEIQCSCFIDENHKTHYLMPNLYVQYPPAIEMEKHPGISARDYLDQKYSQLSLIEALKIMRGMIAVLLRVHQKNHVHYDVKPENFLIHFKKNGECQVALIDRGFAGKRGIDRQNGGSRDYLSPTRGQVQPISQQAYKAYENNRNVLCGYRRKVNGHFEYFQFTEMEETLISDPRHDWFAMGITIDQIINSLHKNEKADFLINISIQLQHLSAREMPEPIVQNILVTINQKMDKISPKVQNFKNEEPRITINVNGKDLFHQKYVNLWCASKNDKHLKKASPCSIIHNLQLPDLEIPLFKSNNPPEIESSIEISTSKADTISEFNALSQAKHCCFFQPMGVRTLIAVGLALLGFFGTALLYAGVMGLCDEELLPSILVALTGFLATAFGSVASARLYEPSDSLFLSYKQ